jgi:hypothetical protein
MTDLVLTESRSGGLTKADDGTYEVILIVPGQGSSGYYTEELIASDAQAAFPKGSHSYLDHVKEGETRSPANLLGVLVEDTRIAEDGTARNRFKPMPHWAAFVEAVAPHCGLSISAHGTGKRGEMGGRETLIVESLIPSIQNSVDLVSYAGAGGKFVESLMESALAASEGVQTESSAPGDNKKENEMAFDEEKAERLLVATEALVAELTEARAKLAEADAEKVEAPSVADVIAATRAVESAEVTASVKESLIKGIEAGDLEVQAKLDEHKALRDEVLAELRESAGIGAAGTGTPTDTLVVKGW